MKCGIITPIFISNFGTYLLNAPEEKLFSHSHAVMPYFSPSIFSRQVLNRTAVSTAVLFSVTFFISHKCGTFGCKESVSHFVSSRLIFFN